MRLPVRNLRQLGLTVIAEEQVEGPAGHALISQLSITSGLHEKAKFREIQVRLAELASKDIVHFPDA